MSGDTPMSAENAGRNQSVRFRGRNRSSAGQSGSDGAIWQTERVVARGYAWERP